ncbi:unnamed protein product [Adineta steineri]|uniref:GDP-D-glucose phosphorylase 1 n=1 Tax=Adineta steineri TaxID=433720 RepID=A0A815K921_9BILA|nr:unnamed protein product [Adineta steineri]CAF3897402.1 unnamed protein product [Adineta steineri]
MWKHLKFDPTSANFSYRTDEKFNEFDTLLRCEWDRAVTQGLFTFQIDHHAKYRILDKGNLNYIIQLNPSRYEKRRTPYPFENVNTPFDKNKFNFNKIKNEEILFSLDNEQDKDKYLIIINNSPIRPYHVLLVPNRELEQSQNLTIDCILFGLQFVVSSAHPYILVGFNSLCGYASMNHLHLHGLYLPERLYLQTITCNLFHEKSNCYILSLYDTQAFVFEIQNLNEFEKIARYICKITDYLSLQNIAHNMAIVKGESFSSSTDALRIFIWFRQSVVNGTMFERCNFACIELAGFMPLQYEEIFNGLTASGLREDLNKIVLPADEQQRIKEDVKHLLDNSFL